MRGTQRKPPSKPVNPGNAKGDGIKGAQSRSISKPSKLAPVGAAKKRER
jgi:hypothetical protein